MPSMPSSSSDESAVRGEVADGALDLAADLVAMLDFVPRIGFELADAEGDFLLLFVHAEHHGFDFLAHGEHVGRARDGAWSRRARRRG